jgi:putative transcriptional regulator
MLLAMGRTKEDPLFHRTEAARTAQDLSRQALPDAAGLHDQTIGCLDRSKDSPSLTLALRLVEVLGLNIQELFSVRPFETER